MTLRRMFAWGSLVAAAVLAGWLGSAHAQAGMWRIDTNTCAPDGSRCIKGLLKDGPAYATVSACQKAMQTLAKQYHQENLKVMYIRCVQLRH